MRRDVSASVNTFIIRHIKGKVKSLTPKVLLKKLAYTLKCDIRATYITDRFQQKVYRYKENEESPTPLEILIYEGHSYALIPKEEGGEIFLKKYDKEEKCYKVEIVPDIRHKEQELILSPNYEERKENKCRIATFDLETCDKENREFKGELLRTDTEVYSFGYYDEGTLAKYHSRIKRRKDDDILSLFLLYLQYKVEGDVIIYAHNGGRFDNFLLLSKILQSFNWRIEQYLESNGRIINMKVVFQKGKVKKNFYFRDSYNFINSSLDKACRDFKTNTKKLKDLVDHDLVNIDNCWTDSGYRDFPCQDENGKEFKGDIEDYTGRYLYNDCVCLYEIVSTFNGIIKSTYGFSIKDVLTNASIARRVWYKYYNPDETPIYTLGRRVDAELREHYFGGRNECFHSLGYKKGKFYYYDFTSLYPYVQGKYEYPYGKYREVDLGGTDTLPDEVFGFVRVRVRNTHFDELPLHGYWDKKSCKLLFPHFQNWTELVIFSEEIRYSLDNDLGYEYEFLSAYTYERKGRIFKKLIEELYKMKLEAQEKKNKALRSTAKTTINSSYGFWGINFINREGVEIKVETCDVLKSKDENRECRYWGYFYTQKLKEYKRVGRFDIYRKREDIDAGCANVGIASAITSYARRELYALLRDIKKRGGEIYYCDTDSVITDFCVEKCKSLQHYIGEGGKNLGELTNETEEPCGYYTELITLAPKFYALRNPELKDNNIVLKVKGVQSKKSFNTREVDDDKKEIRYSELSKDGTEKMRFEDFKLLSEGYDLVCDNMSFLSGSGNLLFKEQGLLKQRNKKALRGVIGKYSKADIVEGEIVPYQL
jgi:hypothetical protein